MDKEALLNELSAKVASGEISKAEVLDRISEKGKKRVGMSRIFYGIGAVVILIGLGFLIAQIWQDSGGVCFVSLVFPRFRLWPKKPLLTIFTLFHSTVAVYLFVAAIVADSSYSYGVVGNIYVYLTMIVGLSYLFLAWAFRDGWNKVLVGLLHSAGSLGIMGAAFSQVIDDGGAWEVVFPVFIILALFASIKIGSRAILVVGTVSILAYLSYITNEYFADSIG